VLALWTGRPEGDLGPAGGVGLEERRRRVVDRPWRWVRQVHGAAVAVVSSDDGGPDPGPVDIADALVANGARSGPALAIFTADCAPVALASPQGTMAAVHAGWKGLVAGVIPAAVCAMRELGATDVVGALGPCIHPECYEFGPEDLAVVGEALGAPVAGRTRSGSPALDLPAAVHASAERAGIRMIFDSGACTACSDGWYSHRASADPKRQALVVWRG